MPTSEQAACIEAFRTRENMTISALAGTGKTSTLKMLSREAGIRRGLYLAYNRSVADEAKAGFSGNTSCMTAHSLAYRWAINQWGEALRTRLRGVRVPPNEVAKILGARDYLRFGSFALAPYQVVRIAMETVQAYCYTGDDIPGPQHVPLVRRIDTPTDRAQLAEAVVPLARRAWQDLSRPDGVLRFSHDNYLKLYCLTRPRLPFEFVMLDEGQDANGVVVQLLREQQAQVVVVGDANQSIYQWRGATNAMDAFDSAHDLYLTRSWRFGEQIADEANLWLDVLGAKMTVLGNPDRQSSIAPLGENARAVLCRTNAAAVEEVIDCHLANRSVAIVGGGDDIVRFAKAVIELKDRGRTNHPDLFPFKNWGEVQTYVEESHDGRDLKVWVTLIDDYGPDGVIEAMEKCVNYGAGANALEAERRAQVVVSTAHKAKGREWDSVRVSEDFRDQEPQEDLVTGCVPDFEEAEGMLAYVTVTRARNVLDVGGLDWVRNLRELQ